jgi:hypothetical protein
MVERGKGGAVGQWGKCPTKMPRPTQTQTGGGLQRLSGANRKCPTDTLKARRGAVGRGAVGHPLRGQYETAPGGCPKEGRGGEFSRHSESR